MTDGFKKLLKTLLVFAVIAGVGWYLKSSDTGKKLRPKGSSEVVGSDVFSGGTEAPGRLNRPLRVWINTWNGFAGGPYFNNGFKASTNSNFYKNYQLQVEFIKNDDFDAGIAAFRKGAVDVGYCTADSFPVYSAGLKNDEPVIVFQSDWSRGGDAIVVAPGIKTVADLKGKEIACAIGSPSQTLLLWMLSANNMSMADIELVKTKDGLDSASAFKGKKVPAAVVWSPDDQDCMAAVPGSTVLISTKMASRIIADCFYVKKSFLEAHPDDVKAFVEGWLKGNAAVNTSAAAKQKAAVIMATGFNVEEGFCTSGITNARLCTFGDNQNFFGLNKAYAGITGQRLYESMAVVYQKIKLADDNVPAWRSISDASVLRSITSLSSSADLAEGEKQFAKLDEVAEEKLETISTNRVTINFDSGSSQLSDVAKYMIDDKFGSMIQGFADARVRIEGNTDNIGGDNVNIPLSAARAKAVASYLSAKYKLDSDRFVIRGNGSTNPVDSNDTDEGRAANRRTDFELVK